MKREDLLKEYEEVEENDENGYDCFCCDIHGNICDIVGEPCSQTTIYKKRKEEVKVDSLKTQVGGDHYKKYPIQPIEYTLANKLDFPQGCIVKYITRFRDKGGKSDLLKIKHIVDILIEREYPEKGMAVE